MVYDVEEDEEESTIQEIYDRNIEGVPYEEFVKEFRCVHKYPHRDRTDTRENWIVECSPRIRNILRARDRVFIGWQSCRVKDYNPVFRCYHCQAFGHIAKHCKNKQVCPHCAGGHDLKNCRRKDSGPRCANCKVVQKEYHHEIGSKTCPEYERVVQVAFAKVDYGP